MPLQLPAFMAGLGSDDEFEGEAKKKTPKGEAGKGSARVLPASVKQKFAKEDEDLEQEEETKPPGRRSRGSGGRGGGTSSSQPARASNDEQMAALADLMLEVKLENREFKGVFERTCLVPADLHCVQVTLSLAAKIGKDRQKRRGQNLGSAHAPLAIQFFSALSDTKEFQNHVPLLDLVEQFFEEVVNKVDKDELPFFINIFRLAKPKKANGNVLGGAYARLSFRLAAPDTLQDTANKVELEMVNTFKALGWPVKWGTPPATTKERRVKDLFQK